MKRIKKYCKVISIMLCIVLLNTSCFTVNAVNNTDSWENHAAKSFADGTGSEDDPYVISSATELALLAKLVNEGNKKYSYAHYIQTKDIDLFGYEWIPIGTYEDDKYEKQFSGTYNGNGYEINNMSITQDDASYCYFGLFGSCMEAKIENVTLNNAKIQFKHTDSGWQSSNGMGSSLTVGGIVADAWRHSTISSCTVNDILINIDTSMSITCGGLAGSINYCDVEKSKASGNITVTASRAIWTGGFAGDISNEVTISQCRFKGSVSSYFDGTKEEYMEEQGYTYIHFTGGFCGDAGRANSDVNINNCYSIADVYAENSYGVQDTGGFAGAVGVLHGDCNFENLYYKGNITTKKSDVIFSETSFWQGEHGFWLQYNADSWQCKNCISVFDNELTVRNVDLSGKNETIKYDINDNYSIIFKDTLLFDESYWTFYEDKLPVLKIENTFSIKTPSTTTIRHKDGIVLHASVDPELAEGYYIEWTESNSNFKTEPKNDGESLQIISDSNGKTIFTISLYDSEGNLVDSDSVEMTSKAGFFDKIGSFFRSLFGGTTIYEY